VIFDPPPIPAPVGVDQSAWDAAVAAIRGYCHWHIAPVAVETVAIDAVDGRLVAPTLRLVSVDTILWGGVSSDLTLVTTTGNTINRSYRFTGRATVTITHGWPVLPADLAEAAKALVAVQAAAASAPGVAALGSGSHTVRFGSAAEAGYAGMPAQIAATLDRYWIPACP